MTESSTAEQLAAVATTMYREPLPGDFRDAVAMRLIDQLGVQIACGGNRITTRVARYFEEQSRMGRATAVVSGTRLPAEDAAFINSVAGHGAEFDDTCLPVQTHSGAVVFPAATAVAEQVDASLEQLIAAAGIGVEVMLRVARALAPHCLALGIHTPQVAGPFGVAVAAGLLLGSDQETIAQSLQVAGSSVGGLTEYTRGGGSTKRLHTAVPASWGIRAAHFARLGITGPRHVFEGPKGLVQAFGRVGNERGIVADWTGAKMIFQVSLKAYNCCYFIHAPIEALAAIIDDGVAPEDVVTVRVGASPQSVQHVGAIRAPADALGAQFSTAYVLASLLRGGSVDMSAFGDAFVPDPSTVSLAQSIEMYEDGTAAAEYPANWGAVVSVVTRNGTVHEHRVRHAKGTPEQPMSTEEIWQKFRANAEDVVGVAQTKRLWDHVVVPRPGMRVRVRDLMALTVRDRE